MSVVNICLWAYIFLKPFYITQSGTLQISDCFIIMAFILVCTKEKKKISIENLIYIIFFVLSIVLINLLYYLRYYNNDFLHSTLYYIFILIGIIVFNTKIKDRYFLEKCYYVFSIDIILQFLIFLFGLGRYWHQTTRYMGTLNDPNQFAFFIFLCLMYIYVIENILKRKRNLWIYMIGIFLIFFSASTGILLGLTIFTTLSVVFNTDYILKLKKIIVNKKMIIALLIIILFVILLIFDNEKLYKIKYFIDTNIINSSIIQRTMEKFDEANESDRLAEDRNLDMLFNNWEHIFYGAGEGYYERYGSKGEIHSTLPSILFYYGIIPTFILLCWVYRNLKGIRFKYLIPYIAILVESFTLLNQRQLFLWVLVIIAVNFKDESFEENNKKIIYIEERKNDKVFYNNSGLQ